MVAVGDQVDFYGERNPELDRIFGTLLLAQAESQPLSPASVGSRPSTKVHVILSGASLRAQSLVSA